MQDGHTKPSEYTGLWHHYVVSVGPSITTTYVDGYEIQQEYMEIDMLRPTYFADPDPDTDEADEEDSLEVYNDTVDDEGGDD